MFLDEKMCGRGTVQTVDFVCERGVGGFPVLGLGGELWCTSARSGYLVSDSQSGIFSDSHSGIVNGRSC